jgi:hypothetical protein
MALFHLIGGALLTETLVALGLTLLTDLTWAPAALVFGGLGCICWAAISLSYDSGR